MFHGWLFDEEVMDEKEDRLGISKWPLVGILESHGILPCDFVGDDPGSGCIPSSIPELGKLRPGDQHIHWVTDYQEIDGYFMDLSDWHFGSDMARFQLSTNSSTSNSINWAWVVCVDLNTKRCQLSLVLISLPNLDFSFEPNIGKVEDILQLKVFLQERQLLEMDTALTTQLDLCLSQT